MKKTSAFKQIGVCIDREYRLFKEQGNWKFIVIATVISFLVCMIVGKDMFQTYDSTKSGFFAIISGAIWIGTFNSIQKICKEHTTIRSKYLSGMHIHSYVIASIIFEMALCLIQAIILMGICMIFIDFPSHSIVFGSAIPEYFITLFLIIWCSDIMGVMISSIASTPNGAMTAMPFVLILQLVMSGVLFELKGWAEIIANITYSKWGMSALGSIGNLNDENLPLKISEVFPEVTRLEIESAYEATKENLLTAWGYIFLIGMCCMIISIISLKFRNRGA